MSDDKLPEVTVGPLIGKKAHLLAALISLILVCDIATFALCFWWYGLGLRLSGLLATLAPIGFSLGILIVIAVMIPTVSLVFGIFDNGCCAFGARPRIFCVYRGAQSTQNNIAVCAPCQPLLSVKIDKRGKKQLRLIAVAFALALASSAQ